MSNSIISIGRNFLRYIFVDGRMGRLLFASMAICFYVIGTALFFGVAFRFELMVNQEYFSNASALENIDMNEKINQGFVQILLVLNLIYFPILACLISLRARDVFSSRLIPYLFFIVSPVILISTVQLVAPVIIISADKISEIFSRDWLDIFLIVFYTAFFAFLLFYPGRHTQPASPDKISNRYLNYLFIDGRVGRGWFATGLLCTFVGCIAVLIVLTSKLSDHHMTVMVREIFDSEILGQNGEVFKKLDAMTRRAAGKMETSVGLIFVFVFATLVSLRLRDVFESKTISYISFFLILAVTTSLITGPEGASEVLSEVSFISLIVLVIILLFFPGRKDTPIPQEATRGV